MAHHIFAKKKHGNLSVQEVLELLSPAFAPQGNQRRIPEEVIMAKFIAFLKSIEGNMCLFITDNALQYLLLT